MSIDASLLTSYYNAKAGITTSAASSGSGSGTTSTTSSKTLSPTGKADAPSAPWTSSSGMLQESDLVTKVLGGQRFINPNAVTSNVTGASADYTKLFTLYQGLNALEGLAAKAQDTKISSLSLAEVKRRFAAGMEEVNSYIADTKYDHVSLTPGTLTNELKSSAGTARTDTVYTAPAIHSGTATSEVKAFTGDVKFSISAKKIGTATPIQVDIDLSEMGTQTRSMSNVVSFINDKLKSEGLRTKFVVNRTAAVPTTSTVNGKTVTLSKGVDSFGLQIKGDATETLTFNAASTADSVYVVQSTGDATKKVTAKTGDTANTSPTDVTSQLLKFQTDVSSTATAPSDAISKVGAQYWTSGEAGQTTLPDSVANVDTTTTTKGSIANVLHTAAGPDGSVYVLANVDAATSGQDIKGTQDVALMKYDSAGKLVFTRTLGASDTASGYALSVASDGRVAIAGSVTGALEGTTAAADASVTDSFVTVFDATGVEQWTQRRGATAADEATSVTFGSDGSVYVGGRTQSLMAGATGKANGGWDGYVTGYTTDGKFKFSEQSGTSQTDSTAQLAVSGNTLYVASLDNNKVLLKSYDISSGKPVLQTSRDLGAIGGGNISGISVYGGKVYLGGSSGTGDLLSTGTQTNAYSGGYDAFALSVNADLTQTADDKVAFYGGTGSEKNAQVQFSDGKAWISGASNGAIDGTTQLNTKTGTQDAYLARVNIDTGQAEYQRRYSGTDGIVQPSAIALSKGSSSVLDKLGLPMGTIVTTDSDKITANTSVRAGDQFYLVDPSTGVKKAITIDAAETMDTLAKKIERASGYKLTVDVKKVLGKQQNQLDITPANSSSKMQLVSGPAGKDALDGLGLDAGLISTDATKAMDAKSSNYLTSKKPMGLSFDSSLNLNSDANIKTALDSLQTTMKNVQKVYSYLKYGDPQDSSSTKKGNSSGTVPQYMTDQIANYQAALNRLTGGA